MKIYSKMLKVGGKMEFSMVLENKGLNKNFQLLAKRQLSTDQHRGLSFDGEKKDAPILHYLKQVKGLELANYRLFETAEGEWIFTAELTKTHENVAIPDLHPVNYDPRGTPPVREFSF
jgi:hypothetical protein